MSFSSQLKSIYSGHSRWAYRPGVNNELVNTAVVNLFTVQPAGDIQLDAIFGIVTTQIGGAAVAVQFRILPTFATGAPAQQVISAVSGAGILNGMLVNTLVLVADGVGGAITSEITYGVAVGFALMATQRVLTPGVINVIISGATAAGAVDWYLAYTPVSDGARVTPL